MLLSFCNDKTRKLDKEEEQFVCRLHFQLQSSLNKLHELFVDASPGARLGALRCSHNWRVANNFGQPRGRSPPVPALISGPTPSTSVLTPCDPCMYVKFFARDICTYFVLVAQFLVIWAHLIDTFIYLLWLTAKGIQ